MPPDEPDVTVEVETHEDETPDVVEDAPDVVVVDTGDDSGNDLDIGVALGALTVQVGTLTETVNTLVARQASTEATADTALSVAVDASIEAEQAVVEAESVLAEAEEAAEDAVEEMIEPNREHWLWKRRGGLKEVD